MAMGLHTCRQECASFYDFAEELGLQTAAFLCHLRQAAGQLAN